MSTTQRELEIELTKKTLPRQLAQLMSDEISGINLQYIAQQNRLKVKTCTSADDKVVVEFTHEDDENLIIRFIATVKWSSTVHP